MTEKQFIRNITGQIYDTKNEKFYHEDYEGKPIEYEDEVVALLNELAKENEQIRNKKERYKRLSEIRQQQINNRILTIKEFINNCSDNKVKKILEDLFYSEVKEYDLSAQNRKLLHENEQLKDRYNEQSVEYEGLEEQVERLLDFKDNVFNLINAKIKQYEHKPFSAPVGQPMSVNFDADVDRIARLSELQDLKKELKE